MQNAWRWLAVKSRSSRWSVHEHMTQNQNGPALPNERETVDCHCGGDIGGDNTQTLRLQLLTRSGFPFTRAALLAPLIFGGAPYA